MKTLLQASSRGSVPAPPEKRFLISPRDFPRMRKSHCAQQSFAVELKRLRAMSVEDRVLEALEMDKSFPGLQPTRTGR